MSNDQWVCVYCGTELADQHSTCCGKVGHTELRPSDDEPPPLKVDAHEMHADSDLWVNPP